MTDPVTTSSAVTHEGTGEPQLDVCLATPLFYPEYSGAGLRLQRYAPGLRARGVSMHVVVPAIGARKKSRRYVGTGDGESGLPTPDPELQIHRVPTPTGARGWRARRLHEAAVMARCEEASTRPDLVIWLGLSPYSAPNLLRLRRQGIPSIYIATIVKQLSRPGLKQRIKRFYWPLRYRFVDCVMVGSSVMRDSLRELGVKTRIEVITHGVNLERFRPDPVSPGHSPARLRLGLDADSEMVLFIGPIHQRKGLDYLAAAWDRVAAERPKAHLVLVGPERAESAEGSEPFGTQLRATLSRGSGGDRVSFVGPVDDPEEYLRAADLLVFPSHREGMPNVVCEAFASGLACVLTPFLGLPEEFGRPDEQYVLVEHDAGLLDK